MSTYVDLNRGDARGVVEQNTVNILSEIGYNNFRAYYYAAILGIGQGVEFTGGVAVDRVIIADDGRPPFLTSNAGTTRDLLIGSGADAQEFKSGAGGDFVYAGGGDDFVDGGAGNDWLDGGTGLDGAVLEGVTSFL